MIKIQMPNSLNQNIAEAWRRRFPCTLLGCDVLSRGDVLHTHSHHIGSSVKKFFPLGFLEDPPLSGCF